VYHKAPTGKSFYIILVLYALMKSGYPLHPPPPPKGRITKRDRVRYAFYIHREDTPISIRDAWDSWSEIREIHPTYKAFQQTVYRLSGAGDRHHLYAIKRGMTVLYMINLACIWYLFQRGYISKTDEDYARKWVIFTIQDEMEPDRVERIIMRTKYGWRTWVR